VLLLTFITVLIAQIKTLRKFRQKNVYSFELPDISVVVAAKNESLNSENLIKVLSELDYPDAHYEVIIVDDNSDDDTNNRLHELCRELPNFRIIHGNNKVHPGKKGALKLGIENAAHNIIAITDADCSPGRKWLRAIAEAHSKGYQFVFGPVKIIGGDSFGAKFSRYDNLRSQLLTLSAAGVSFPYACSGGSLSFTKSLFLAVGGYSGTLKTLSGDDDLLLQKALNAGYKTGTITEPEAIVTTYPYKDFRQVVKQKTRHLSTSKHYNLKHSVFLLFWHAANYVMVYGFLYGLLTGSDLVYWLTPIKLLSDIIIYPKMASLFRNDLSLTDFIFFGFIYEILLFWFFLLSVFKKQEWK